MNRYFLFLFIFTAQTLCAQKLPHFFEQDGNSSLSSWIIDASTEEKVKALKTFTKENNFGWVLSQIEEDPEEIAVYFDFLDFDKDGIRDLIFQGMIGGESTYVVLLKGTGKGYKTIRMLAGKIYWSSKATEGGTFQFKLLNYPCCLGRVEYLEHYTIKQQQNSVELALTNRESFISETEFPEKTFAEPIAFETLNDPYTLRLSPKIDETTPYFPEDTKGNAIAYYGKGAKGIALAEASDESGRVWWFVKMISPEKSGIFSGSGENSKAPYHCYGWMSSRFVKVLGK